MPIYGDGLADEQGQGLQGQVTKVKYVMHPNCAVEEM